MLQLAIVDQVRLNAQSFPERPALEVVGGPSLTFAEAWRRIVALADAVRDEPERGGRRMVGVLLPNGPDAALTHLACQLAGCTSVPLNSLLAAPELDFIVRDAGVTAVFTSAPFLEAAAAFDTSPRVVDCAGIATPDSVPDVRWQGRGEDPMLVAYTSGTTGLPKGALNSCDSMYLNYMRWGWQFGLNERQTLLTGGPMFHMSYGGLSAVALMAGATNRILPRFDGATALDELSTRSTFSFLVPTMLRGILDVWEQRGRPPAEAARFLLSSGAPVTADLLRGALTAFPRTVVAEAYGWSEGGWVTFETKTLDSLRPQCVGWPMPGYEIAVLRDDLTPCDTGEAGEIAARNLVPFLGYLNNPAATEAAQHEGFVLSGDVGVVDEDGRIRVVDRKKDMIVTGGENVYSAEVERVLLEHPDVAEVAVVGRPDPRWGEAIVAVVVPVEGGAAVDPHALRGYCRGRLATYKVPKTIELAGELPRNAMGKVQKFRLRDGRPAVPASP